MVAALDCSEVGAATGSLDRFMQIEKLPPLRSEELVGGENIGAVGVAAECRVFEA
jgi:hypothetical protein